MDSYDLSEQRIVQLEQIPVDIQRQIEKGDGTEYALDLSLNRLRSVDQIGVFEHVNELDLSGNQLESVNGIQGLRRLQSLDLSRNCIANIELMALLPVLQVLKVAENSLTALDSLQFLPELRVVDASYNRITKWPPLAGLSLLETLDLSDNMLEAFSSSLSATLFPSRLRRLSIARNQIDKLCGVACLGLQLPMLEFLAFDGNPIVLEVARSGGQLERLLATFFPSVPLSNDGGLTMSGRRHEEFTSTPRTLNTLKRAILEGHEEALGEFLVTGLPIPQRNLGEVGAFPPPAPASDERNLAGNLLSHDSKLEIWKRIQEDRKAQFSQSSGFTPSSSEVKREKSVRWGAHSVVSAPLEDAIRKPALTASDLFVPDAAPQALDASSLSVMKPLDASTCSALVEQIKDSASPGGVEYEALVKKLTDQVTTMRKYMKVWIKREKMVRDASARKIQRWFRRRQRRFQLRQRVLYARSRRDEEYSFRHCSSTLMQVTNYRGVTQARLESVSIQTIQSHARGFIVRRRFDLFVRKHAAARRIQRAWRNSVHDRQSILQGDWKLVRQNKATTSQQLNSRWLGIVRGVVRCSRDVKQLQEVCAVQDDAIGYLWDNLEPAKKANIEQKVARYQRSWRGPSKRANNDKSESDGPSSLELYPASVVDEMKSRMDQQSLEIDELKLQLQALQNAVTSLTTTKGIEGK